MTHTARLCARLALGFALLSPSLGRATPDSANAEYKRGLDLIRDGNLEEARHTFERAYRDSPHYVVLYNLGRVCTDLGDVAAAKDYFERYLREGGDHVQADRRREVTGLIHDLEQKQPPAEEQKPDNATPPVPSAPPPTPPPPAAASKTHPISPARAPAPTVSPIDLDVQSSRAQHHAFGIAFGATGLALVATGVGLWVYNQGRTTDWKQERDDLAAHPPPSVVQTPARNLAEVMDYQRAVGRNDAHLDSIEQLDVVKWTTVGAGALFLGAGAVLYLTAPRDATVRVSTTGVQFSFSF